MPTYANGKVPRSAMSAFRKTGKYGHPVFIAKLDQAFTAVERELGIKLYIAAGQDIFRDYDGQVYWKNYWTAAGSPQNAAAPGFSNHGLGVSADISGNGTRGTATWNRVAAIFARYGLQFNVSFESWHVTDTSISVAGNVVTINQPAKSGFSGNPYYPSTAKFAAIQGGYNALGYKLVQDGMTGPKTEAATRDFQRKHGLPVDGIHGPKTEAQLAKAVAAKNKPKPPAHRTRPTLKRGSKGQDVRDLQTILTKYHGAKIKVDGDFGVATRDALAAVQRKLGLLGDGVAGPKTWKKLGQ